MAEKITLDLTNLVNLTFDPAFVELVGDSLQLKDLGGSTFTTTPQLVGFLTEVKLSRITGLKFDSLIPGTTEISFVVTVAGNAKFFDGSNWVDSDNTFVQSTSQADFLANFETLTIGDFQNKPFGFSFFLSSPAGTETPSIKNLKLNFVSEVRTSGSTNHNITMNDIITLASEYAGQLSDGGELTPEKFASARKILNNLLKTDRSGEILINKEERQILEIEPSDVVNVGGIDFSARKTHISTEKNSPTSPASDVFWRELTTTVGVSFQLDQRYESSAEKLLDENIFDLRKLYRLDTTRKIEVFKKSSDEFNDRHTRHSILVISKPEIFFFRRSPRPELHLFPAPLEKIILEASVLLQIEDLDENFDFADVNPERVELIIFNLALRLGIKSPISNDTFSRLILLQKESDEKVRRSDLESAQTTVHFKPFVPTHQQRYRRSRFLLNSLGF